GLGEGLPLAAHGRRELPLLRRLRALRAPVARRGRVPSSFDHQWPRAGDRRVTEADAIRQTDDDRLRERRKSHSAARRSPSGALAAPLVDCWSDAAPSGDSVSAVGGLPTSAHRKRNCVSMLRNRRRRFAVRMSSLSLLSFESPAPKILRSSATPISRLQ